MRLRRSLPIAATTLLVATMAVAQTVPTAAERQVAATATRAELAASTITIIEEFTDWAPTCVTDVRTNVRGCSLFTRMLVIDGLGRAAVAISVASAAAEPMVRIASDASFPTRVVVTVDTLPAIETKQCNANACTYTGPGAAALIEEFKTGATVVARYEARGGDFEGRLPLETFVTKYGQLTQ
ncbi:MAG: hypothetical protein EXQ93_00500 [Alphaproteobacteria bacterium]|nr:hypothetical protein [Alphaproteobacteria bacterium]